MSRSSIFSFKTLNISGFGAGWLTALGCVVTLFLIDAGIRLWDPVMYGGWNNPGLQHKINTARNLAQENGKIDVMLQSVSIGLQVDVSRWNHATNGQVLSYNAAMYGQRPPLGRLLFENIYYPECKPDKLIYLLCPYDLNSYGLKGDAARYQGFFWDSLQVRKLLADSFIEKLKVNLHSMLYMVTARQEMRRFLQRGPIKPDLIFMEDGVMFPTVGKSAPQPPTPEEKVSQDNPNRDYFIPEDGALKDLLALANFCRDNGVEFVLVNQPVSPYSNQLLPDPDADYAKYLAAIDKVRQEGFLVLDAAADLDLPNSSFPDPLHLNRWGAFELTDYLYQNLIVKWYPEACSIPALVRPAELNLYKSVPATSSYTELQSWRMSPEQMMANPIQVALKESGIRLNIEAPIPPGQYIFDLYTADDASTAPLNAKTQSVTYEIQGKGHASKVEVPLSRDAHHWSRMSRTKLDLPTTSTVSIVADDLGDKNKIVLDTLFIYPIKEAVPGSFQPDTIEKMAQVPDPMPAPN